MNKAMSLEIGKLRSATLKKGMHYCIIHAWFIKITIDLVTPIDLINFGLPLARAKKIIQLDGKLPKTNGNIAAIDFGTSQMSVAYTLMGESVIHNLKFGVDVNLRIPSVILLRKRADGIIEVEAIGTDAQTRFIAMKSKQHSNYIYFDKVKIQMKREKVQSKFLNNIYMTHIYRSSTDKV